MEAKQNQKLQDFLVYDDSDTKNQKDVFSERKVSASVEFLIETVMEGIKPVSIHIKQSGYREDSILIAQFGIFFRLKMFPTDFRSKVLKQIILYKSQILD